MKKVFVGMSGGVDSSVSAFLLKKKGYEVHGVFIRGWYPFDGCGWQQEEADALRVAAKLGIKFSSFDAESIYKENVGEYILNSYKEGLTPNGDVLCNKFVKFGAFYSFAIENGADFVAFGHYASIKKVSNENRLFIPKDEEKDQTYFLWKLDRSILDKVIFPLEDLNKDEVRNIAEKEGFHNFNKKDSVGVCFLGELDMRRFLEKYFGKQVKGNVIYKGENIGEHDGIIFYTIGQRISIHKVKKEFNGMRFFVAERDLEKNEIVVDIESVGSVSDLSLSELNIIGDISDVDYCIVRYNGPKISVKSVNKEKVVLEEPILNSSGQSIVFYSKNGECIGGAIY